MPPRPLDTPDLICLSHLRWNFVFQRPQHLLTRCASERRVYYVEEPYFDADVPTLQLERDGNITIVVPHLPGGHSAEEHCVMQRQLIDQLIAGEQVTDYVLWYYTPMALGFTDHLQPQTVVYDCMDELSAFANAPTELKLREAELLRRASVVFTGGQSLYEAKRDSHHNVRAFPSSVDVAHFSRARRITTDPEDQAGVPHPRLGFFGVLDERLDVALLSDLATARPDWQFIMVGPVVKIDPATLPTQPNIHYLGPKKYEQLPDYIAGWDVALLLFARNDATKYISPTKTPEYMAAGKPVVSTSIRDVVRPYGLQGLVRIADSVDEFVVACEAALAEDATTRLREHDAFLRQTSWDGTWAQMRSVVLSALNPPTSRPARAAGAS